MVNVSVNWCSRISLNVRKAKFVNNVYNFLSLSEFV